MIDTRESKVHSYRVLLRKEPEGGYTVVVPALPGCVTYGENIDEAIVMGKEAIELYIESLKAHNEEIPSDEGTLFRARPLVPRCQRCGVGQALY